MLSENGKVEVFSGGKRESVFVVEHKLACGGGQRT